MWIPLTIGLQKIEEKLTNLLRKIGQLIDMFGYITIYFSVIGGTITENQWSI